MLNPVNILIVITTIFALLRTRGRNDMDRWVLTLLFLSVANEAASIILDRFGMPSGCATNVYIVIHQLLWFRILMEVSHMKRSIFIAATAFISFVIVDLVLEGFLRWKPFTFSFGAALYLGLFMASGIRRMSNEDLEFFQSPGFILISAPVVFFAGFSMLFSFDDPMLHQFRIGGTVLFTWVSYFVNLIYYGLLMIYISRPKNVFHDA